MNRYHRVLLPACLLSLSFGLASCDLLNSFFPSDTTTTSDPATAPATSPAAQAPAAPAASPFATLAPSPAAAPAKANFVCASPSYVATVTWQNNQPSMALTGPNQISVLQNTGARYRTNPDNSATYEVAKDSLFYARVYPNRTCFIQVVNPANNSVTIEETGSLR